MEYLEENLEDWLGEELESFGDDDYIVFDCPGQIELYTNSNVFRAFTQFLQSNGWNVSYPSHASLSGALEDASTALALLAL